MKYLPAQAYRRGGFDPSLIKWIILAAIIGGVAFWINGKMNPEAVTSATARRAEAFAVMGELKIEHAISALATGNVREIAEKAAGRGDLSMGGSDMLILSKDASDGEFVIAEVTFNRKYLANQQTKTDELSLDANNIKLVDSTGAEYAPMFLTGSYDETSVVVGIRAMQAETRMPHESPMVSKWRSPAATTGEIKPKLDLLKDVQGFEGSREYSTKRGIDVQIVEGGPKAFKVSWNAGVTGWRAANYRKEVVDPMGAWGEWPVRMLFPTPTNPGPYQLKVHGQVVTTLNF